MDPQAVDPPAIDVPGASPSLLPFFVVHESLPIAATVLWLIAYAALLQKLRKDRTAQGLSLQSLFALAVAETLSFVSLACLLGSAYRSTVSLPLFICQGINCFLVNTTFSLGTRHASASYQAEDDDFGTPPSFLEPFLALVGKPTSLGSSTPYANRKPASRIGSIAVALHSVFRWHWVTLYALALACSLGLEMFHSHRVLPLWLSLLESFAGMIMALALLPQVRMFYKKGRQPILNSLGKFVVAMLMARAASLTYWVTDWYFHGPKVMPGRGIRLLTETLNVVILMDFTWSLYKSRGKSQAPPLPL